MESRKRGATKHRVKDGERVGKEGEEVQRDRQKYRNRLIQTGRGREREG